MRLEFHDIWKSLTGELVPILENSEALSFFAHNRAKFEGWLKVELCGVLARHSTNVIPEKHRIDVVVDDWAIELKTVNTNYRCEGVLNKKRPITRNISGVLTDIAQLKLNPNYQRKAVAFIVFPLPATAKKWPYQLDKVRAELVELQQTEFHFRNQVRGMLFLGLVSQLDPHH